MRSEREREIWAENANRLRTVRLKLERREKISEEKMGVLQMKCERLIEQTEKKDKIKTP